MKIKDLFLTGIMYDDDDFLIVARNDEKTVLVDNRKECDARLKDYYEREIQRMYVYKNVLKIWVYDERGAQA